MSDSFYLRTKYYTITEDGFMHNHQAALDSQMEDKAIRDLEDAGIYPDQIMMKFLKDFMMKLMTR